MMDISERMIFSVVRTKVEPPKDELQGDGENIFTTEVSTNTRFVSSRLNKYSQFLSYTGFIADKRLPLLRKIFHD